MPPIAVGERYTIIPQPMDGPGEHQLQAVTHLFQPVGLMARKGADADTAPGMVRIGTETGDGTIEVGGMQPDTIEYRAGRRRPRLPQ
ncbi:MAG: hypothetical protein QNJ22_05305 [Desulfosarcinaceae bacterium]|nr:hypothetical protein [Desulfosarcinaceae bacterium]